MTVPALPKLSDLITEFLAPAGTKLSQFLRGGAYVPNTTPNNAVPTVLPIRLLQMANTVRHVPHTAANVPDVSDITGSRPGTINDTLTCNPINGTGPFTYLWTTDITGGSFNFGSPTAKTTTISRFQGGLSPTVTITGTVFCTSTDTSDGHTFVSETDINWVYEA